MCGESINGAFHRSDEKQKFKTDDCHSQYRLKNVLSIFSFFSGLNPFQLLYIKYCLLTNLKN